MQDSYLVNKPCVECRQLFVDMFTNPQADLEFRVLSMETLSGIANYENSQALISEFIKQLVSLNEPGSDPASAIVVDEIKNILLETGNDLNIKTLVDFYIGKTDILTDNPLLLMSAETRSLVEQEISTMLSEHYDRKLIATVLRDAFKENPTQHAQNQLIDLDYPELFVELALAAQQSGLTSQKDYFIDHIYQNLPPDDALRGMYGLSSRNLDTPENFYERTKRWAQRNIGRYTDAFDEIFSNYHNNADRSLKSVAIALAGNLYNESKARSILDRALGIESDPLIRKMIIDELYRLSDADQI